MGQGWIASRPQETWLDERSVLHQSGCPGRRSRPIAWNTGRHECGAGGPTPVIQWVPGKAEAGMSRRMPLNEPSGSLSAGDLVPGRSVFPLRAAKETVRRARRWPRPRFPRAWAQWRQKGPSGSLAAGVVPPAARTQAA
jgi:hypothetical protein